jgi:hypothetical protein
VAVPRALESEPRALEAVPREPEAVSALEPVLEAVLPLPTAEPPAVGYWTQCRPRPDEPHRERQSRLGVEQEMRRRPFYNLFQGRGPQKQPHMTTIVYRAQSFVLPDVNMGGEWKITDKSEFDAIVGFYSSGKLTVDTPQRLVAIMKHAAQLRAKRLETAAVDALRCFWRDQRSAFVLSSIAEVPARL